MPGLGVEAVGAFFAGGGAIQFVKDYAAAGLREKLPLYGSGFLTEGVLKPQGAAAEGMQTALHYGDGLDNPKNIAFRAAFKSFSNRDADVYAVQGYDAAQMLAIGVAAAKGDNGRGAGVLGGDPRGDDRQSARRIHALGLAQSDPDHLVAGSEERRKPRHRRGGRGIGRSRHRLHDDLTGKRPGNLTRVPIGMDGFLVQILNGLQYGLLLFLIAAG